jgi:hypothetical protein
MLGACSLPVIQSAFPSLTYFIRQQIKELNQKRFFSSTINVALGSFYDTF